METVRYSSRDITIQNTGFMKIGDKVRFLSETGGGKIAGFKGKNIVLVEDEDGFQIPTSITDVVVIGNDDYDISKVHTITGKTTKKDDNKPDKRSVKTRINDNSYDFDTDDYEDDPSERPISYKAAVEERKGGDKLSAYLAFVPIDIKSINNTRFEVFFINDSNYYMQYSYLSATGTSWFLRSRGELEPNTKLFLEEIGIENLNDLLHVCIQIQAYKKDKPFLLKPSVDVKFRIDAVKFYKLHTFQENDFFEQPALLFTIIEDDNVTRPLSFDTKRLKEEMFSKKDETSSEQFSTDDRSYVRRYDDNKKKGNPFVIGKRKQDEDIVVVDLHANSILDSTSGMTSADILNYQLEIFRKTLAEYKEKKGQKLIFIHGKGEGVLRHAIIHELNYRYKRYQYQDASFQEYGYGATQITIK